ncbi:Hypothetical predicted protein [Marmota monax]|uniref:Carboxylesterase type B domain-containing protein n=1 Tax=Marmota monax TaxID=9995 RepID=A0A5E4A4D6_MARMO|nr:Hypothetical predicted protein [Marmota monax]
MWPTPPGTHFWPFPSNVLICSPCPAGHPSSPPVVDTVHGKVLGKYVSLEGSAQPVAVFLGVPFAKPPLGPLRFAPPQPAEPWRSVKNTTSYPPMCSQDAVGGQVLSELFTNRKENIPFRFSEDCLYLNIYTPADLTKKSRLPHATYAHFHCPLREADAHESAFPQQRKGQGWGRLPGEGWRVGRTRWKTSHTWGNGRASALIQSPRTPWHGSEE